MIFIKQKIANLINVKTIVTLIIVIVFAVLALTDKIEPQGVMQIVMMVIAFYFGTQHEKIEPK